MSYERKKGVESEGEKRRDYSQIDNAWEEAWKRGWKRNEKKRRLALGLPKRQACGGAVKSNRTTQQRKRENVGRVEAVGKQEKYPKEKQEVSNKSLDRRSQIIAH